MKYILMFVLICFCSSYSWAEAPIKPIVGGSQPKSDDSPKKPIVSKPQQPGKTEPEPPPRPHFWEVMGWYQGGRDVKWSEIKGSYAGRCLLTPAFHYRRNYTNVPKDFREEDRFAIVTYLGASNKSPEVLTSKSLFYTPSLRADQIPYVIYDIVQYPQYIDAGYKIKFTDSPTFTKEYFSASGLGLKSTESYRVFENYLVSIRTAQQAELLQTASEVSPMVPPGQTWKVCYYTQKLTE